MLAAHHQIYMEALLYETIGCGLRNNVIYEYIPFCIALSLSLLYSIVCVRVCVRLADLPLRDLRCRSVCAICFVTGLNRATRADYQLYYLFGFNLYILLMLSRPAIARLPLFEAMWMAHVHNHLAQANASVVGLIVSTLLVSAWRKAH